MQAVKKLPSMLLPIALRKQKLLCRNNKSCRENMLSKVSNLAQCTLFHSQCLHATTLVSLLHKKFFIHMGLRNIFRFQFFFFSISSFTPMKIDHYTLMGMRGKFIRRNVNFFRLSHSFFAAV